MEGTCSEGFLTASSDETECYLYPKRIKTECNQKNVEKEEQQKLEQSVRCVNRYQTSLPEPRHLSERQNNCALEKQSCDTSRKSCVREFFHFQTCSNERLPWRVSESKLSSKNQSSANEDQNTREDAISLNAYEQPLETESLSVWSTAKTCEHLQVLNPPQVQWNNSVDQNNIRNGDNELKQNSSVTPLNGELFQMDSLSHRSVSDKKWKQYQLLQIPFLCGTSSVFSHTEDRKNIFLKKVCSTADKDNSSSDNETPAERDNKDKSNSSYIIPTLKPFKSVQPLKIPNFQLPGISSKISSKMPSTNPKEVVLKDFKGHPSLMQSSKQIYGEQKMSEIGKQKLQNKSSVKASLVGSEFKEKNYSPINKQEHSALAEGGKVSVACFRDNSTDVECNHIFAENNLKDKMSENSDAGDDQDSRIHIYISPKPVHNDGCSDLLKRMGKKSSNEKAGPFHMQANIPAVTEPLEKKWLDMHCGVHNCNSDTHLYEEDSKFFTKEILDFKRYLSKNIFESNSSRTIAQRFPDKKVSCNIFRGKEMFELKFSFQNVLSGWVRTWTESLYKGDEPLWQDDSVAGRFHFAEALDEQCDAQELVKSKVNRNPNSQLCICLLAVTSKHLKVELLKTIPSFFSSTSTFLPTEGKAMQAEKHPSCGRKQDPLNSSTDSALRQTTEFHEKNETYRSFDISKFVESVVFAVHNECQRRHFSRSLGEEESTFLKRGVLLPNQKSVLCKGRRVRKQQLLSRGREDFSTYLRSVNHKGGMKKKNLIAKCLILLQATFDCSSLGKTYGCNITKIQYLMGANLSFRSYFPARSQLKFEKGDSKHTNQKILVTEVKQEKKKPSEVFSSSFHGERFKAFPFVLCENRKHEATRCRNCIMVPNEVTDTMKKYLGTSTCRNADRKECVKSEELQINSHDFHSKKSSIFDTYEKVPLTTDPEDSDQISVVNQGNSARKTSEENVVSSSEEVHNLPGKSKDFLILPEQSKTTVEKCNSLLLQGSHTNKSEYCKKIGTYRPRSANKKVEGQNTYSNFENLFPSSSNVFQSVTLLSDSSSLVNKDRVVSEDGHCRSSSSAAGQNQSETIHAAMQCPPAESPAVTPMYLKLEAEGAVEFSLHRRTQANQAVGLEPATLKQCLKYVEEQEEINYEQMHATNENQCETVMNDLIMSYSEDESETFIASEEKIKIPLSVINNRYSEDVKDKQLPLKNKMTYEFELKRKFGLVLEELHMFHEISKGNENSLSGLETNSHYYCELNSSEAIDENVTSVSRKKVCISSPICGTTEGQNITDCGSSLNEKISNENSQKIPKEYCISRLSSDKLLHSPTAEGNFDATYKKPYTWNPAFLSCTLLKEQIYNLQEEEGYFLSHEVIRLQPLKTCKGPIRIGLSRKARPKQLHPYLK